MTSAKTTPCSSASAAVDDLVESLTPDGTAQVVKRAAKSAGLDGNYASHSLRSGFVTDALDAGATREQVQRYGHWANVRSIDPYYRKTDVWGRSNPSQRLSQLGASTG